MRLLERRIADREAEIARLKGRHVEAGWGNQIRSYVLHPYQMVKDHRTEHETSDTNGVLDGDLDGFMDLGSRVPAARLRPWPAGRSLRSGSGCRSNLKKPKRSTPPRLRGS